MKDKPFNVLQSQCPELYQWLKEISRYQAVESFVLPDYKNGIRVQLFTNNHQYNISARPRSEYKETIEDGEITGASNSPSYLGCTVMTRKPRAGETWNRGNDLPDGPYSYETWGKIKDAILAYELVKVVVK